MTRGWAMVVLLLAVVAAGLGVIAILVVTNDETVVVELDAGDCFDLRDDVVDEIRTVDVIDCDEPHEAEVVATGELNPGRDRPYPADDDAIGEADRACASAVADAPEILAAYGILPAVANRQAWDPLEGRYVCIAIPYGGGTTTGSLARSVPER